MPDTREEFWTIICGYHHALRVLFIVLTVLLVLTIMSLLAVDRRSGTFLVILLDLAILLSGQIGVAFVIRKCRKFD